MVGEETACRPLEVRHEVDDQVVDEDAGRGERNIGEGIGYGYSGGTIESIVGLEPNTSMEQLMDSGRMRAYLLLQNWPTKHLNGHLSTKFSAGTTAEQSARTHFTERVETARKKSSEDDGTPSEGTLRSQLEVIIRSTDNESQDLCSESADISANRTHRHSPWPS